MIVIRIVGDATGHRTSVDGTFVKTFDPDAHKGRGFLTTTTDVKEAMTFESTTAAHAFWTQTSKVQPMRSDGKPNRPLTAYNVELMPI
jgi:hypothetical protein